MFVSFVLLSNLTVADCIINENVMLLFIKNEHFTLLNSVCFWGTSSPRPPEPGLFPRTPPGGKPPNPPSAPPPPARHILLSPPQEFYWGGEKLLSPPQLLQN